MLIGPHGVASMQCVVFEKPIRHPYLQQLVPLMPSVRKIATLSYQGYMVLSRYFLVNNVQNLPLGVNEGNGNNMCISNTHIAF